MLNDQVNQTLEKIQKAKDGSAPLTVDKQIAQYKCVYAKLSQIEDLKQKLAVDALCYVQSIGDEISAAMDAADDAAKALELSGAEPYTLAEVSKPTFTSADAKSVLWANIITETNDIVLTGIINWPSHLSSLFADGYTGVGAYKSISVLLYDKISDTDVRKGWWLNEDFDSPFQKNFCPESVCWMLQCCRERRNTESL